MDRIPLRLKKCPLVDALVEIRFQPHQSVKSVVFALIYAKVQNLFNHRVITLPLSQIPEQIREKDPNLKYKPLYRLEGDDAILQVGPNVICISSRIPYIGWERFSRLVVDVIRSVDSRVLDRVIRIGHRYVNFFENDVTSKLSISLGELKGFYSTSKQFRVDFVINNFNNAVQVSNTAKYRPALGSPEISGSLVDIDTSREYKDGNYFIQHLEEELAGAHSSEKELFYSLLSDELLTSLDPIYERTNI